MSFTELFIRRPVLSMVVSLLILLLGAQGLMSLQVRQYPEVEETTITITTTYVGASADLMQGFISTPIAKSVSSAEGVDYVTSQSRLGVSTVSVRMRLNTDPNAALTEVTSKVQQVRAQLPADAEDPVIVKGTGQTFALMYLTFASSEMNPEQVSEFLTRVMQPRFATLEGVGGAEILGGRDFSMRIWIDPHAPCRARRDRERRGHGDPREQLPRRARQDEERVRRLCARDADDAADARDLRHAADSLRRRSDRAPARRRRRRAGPEEHGHEGQLQRQGRHLHRHHADTGGQSA